MTEAELKAVHTADLPDMERMFVNIMLVFGLRPGEALALQKRNFDLTRKILTVDKAVTHVGNKAILKETKTDVVRKIPIPDQLLPQLKEYFEENKNLLLFTRDGTFMTKSVYRTLCDHVFRAVNAKLGGTNHVNKLNGMTMYSFRHNRATELYYLCQQGVISTKKAAELMGHSEMIFLQVYSHIDESQEKTENLYKDLVI